ncbi:hypothetical protein ACEWY4_015413 [Coilia grayii]|uniref:Uncharacterized protein n=1 Tax=Coilia grayii TaxID=363190 RepID=A0ABD1JN51_9TELE
MVMAVSFSNGPHPDLEPSQYPPPLLPKPGRDNARLQKLIKRSAKKKSASSSQTPIPFRSSLSPVNEISDLELSDTCTPPRTPDVTPYGSTLNLNCFSARPLYQQPSTPYSCQRNSPYFGTGAAPPQPFSTLSCGPERPVAPLYACSSFLFDDATPIDESPNPEPPVKAHEPVTSGQTITPSPAGQRLSGVCPTLPTFKLQISAPAASSLTAAGPTQVYTGPSQPPPQPPPQFQPQPLAPGPSAQAFTQGPFNSTNGVPFPRASPGQQSSGYLQRHLSTSTLTLAPALPQVPPPISTTLKHVSVQESYGPSVAVPPPGLPPGQQQPPTVSSAPIHTLGNALPPSISNQLITPPGQQQAPTVPSAPIQTPGNILPPSTLNQLITPPGQQQAPTVPSAPIQTTGNILPPSTLNQLITPPGQQQAPTVPSAPIQTPGNILPPSTLNQLITPPGQQQAPTVPSAPIQTLGHALPPSISNQLITPPGQQQAPTVPSAPIQTPGNALLSSISNQLITPPGQQQAPTVPSAPIQTPGNALLSSISNQLITPLGQQQAPPVPTAPTQTLGNALLPSTSNQPLTGSYGLPVAMPPSWQSQEQMPLVAPQNSLAPFAPPQPPIFAQTIGQPHVPVLASVSAANHKPDPLMSTQSAVPMASTLGAPNAPQGLLTNVSKNDNSITNTRLKQAQGQQMVSPQMPNTEKMLKVYTSKATFYEISKPQSLQDITGFNTNYNAYNGASLSTIHREKTPTSEVKKGVASSYELPGSRTPAGRPKTPAFQISRAKTPVFEISKANSQLFAAPPTFASAMDVRSAVRRELQGPISSINIRNDVPAIAPLKTSVPEKIDVAQPNAIDLKDSHKEISQAAKVIAEALPIPKITSDVSLMNTRAMEASQLTATPSVEAVPSELTQGYQIPEALTCETVAQVTVPNKFTTPSPPVPPPPPPPQSQRTPLTPVHWSPRPPSRLLGNQRLNASTSELHKPRAKSTYYGLTPVEYAAYGGIKTYYGPSGNKNQAGEAPKSCLDDLSSPKTVDTSSQDTNSLEANKHEKISQQVAGAKNMQIEVQGETKRSTSMIHLSTSQNSSEVTTSSDKTTDQTKTPGSEEKDTDEAVSRKAQSAPAVDISQPNAPVLAQQNDTAQSPCRGPVLASSKNSIEQTTETFVANESAPSAREDPKASSLKDSKTLSTSVLSHGQSMSIYPLQKTTVNTIGPHAPQMAVNPMAQNISQSSQHIEEQTSTSTQQIMVSKSGSLNSQPHPMSSALAKTQSVTTKNLAETTDANSVSMLASTNAATTKMTVSKSRVESTVSQSITHTKVSTIETNTETIVKSANSEPIKALPENISSVTKSTDLISSVISTNNNHPLKMLTGNNSSNLSQDAKPSSSLASLQPPSKPDNTGSGLLSMIKTGTETLSTSDSKTDTLTKSVTYSKGLANTFSDFTTAVKKSTSSSTNTRSTPTIIRKTPLTPTMERGGTSTPNVNMRTSLTPTLDRRTIPTPTFDRRTVSTPVMDRRTTLTPTMERRTPLTPVMDRRTSTTPIMDRRTLSTPTVEKRTSTTPTFDRRSYTTLSTENKVHAKSTMDIRESFQSSTGLMSSGMLSADSKLSAKSTMDIRASVIPTDTEQIISTRPYLSPKIKDKSILTTDSSTNHLGNSNASLLTKEPTTSSVSSLENKHAQNQATNGNTTSASKSDVTVTDIIEKNFDPSIKFSLKPTNDSKPFEQISTDLMQPQNLKHDTSKPIMDLKASSKESSDSKQRTSTPPPSTPAQKQVSATSQLQPPVKTTQAQVSKVTVLPATTEPAQVRITVTAASPVLTAETQAAVITTTPARSKSDISTAAPETQKPSTKTETEPSIETTQPPATASQTQTPGKAAQTAQSSESGDAIKDKAKNVDTDSTVTTDQEKSASSATPAITDKKEASSAAQNAETKAKASLKPKGLKAKLSGWNRLKKHMVVEPEEPKFPETDPETKEAEGDREMGGEGKPEKAAGAKDKPTGKEVVKEQDAPRALKMWDAVLFQMFSTKDNIMKQINASKSEGEGEKKKESKDNQVDIPSFVYHLPVLLYSPRFDARKLKEAAEKPLNKIATMFERGLLQRKTQEEEPKDFNRTARGFGTSKTAEE